MAMSCKEIDGGREVEDQCGRMGWDLKMLRATDDGDQILDSESFQPQFHQIKKLGLKPNHKKYRIGGWTAYENQLYLRFLLKHRQDFECEQVRRKNKVFHKLSKIIKRRTSEQCRSHHQKLQMKHGNDILAIANEVQRKIRVGVLHQMVNIQCREAPQTLKPLPFVDPVQYKSLVRGEWFDIESWRGILKLSIDSKSIQQW